MSLLRRRAAHRSCRIHGDNGCDLQGEAGPRTRAQDRREWTEDAVLAAADAEITRWDPALDSMSRWPEENR